MVDDLDQNPFRFEFKADPFVKITWNNEIFLVA